MQNLRRILALNIIFILTGLFSHSVMAEDVFAIAADGPQPTAQIVKLAGIAPYFHIYDEKGREVKIMPNPHLNMDFGIGPAAAATLADEGVSVLVARRIPGPKMHDVLKQKNVRIVRRIGTVRDVVNELRE